jgi:hypothetical protein
LNPLEPETRWVRDGGAVLEAGFADALGSARGRTRSSPDRGRGRSRRGRAGGRARRSTGGRARTPPPSGRAPPGQPPRRPRRSARRTIRAQTGSTRHTERRC